MSLEEDRAERKKKYDKFLEKIIGKPISKEEMNEALSGVLQEYSDGKNFEKDENNDNWSAYWFGLKSSGALKLSGTFDDGLKVGDELFEYFGNKEITYKIISVDHKRKIYGVDYFDEVELED